MANIQQPGYYTVNGVRYQFASLEMNFGIAGFGSPVLGLQSVDYDQELEPGELRGTSPAVLALTTGKYSCSAKLKLPKAEGTYLEQQLALAGAANPDPLTGIIPGFGQIQWTATLGYYDIGCPFQSDVWYGARIKKDSDSHKVAPDPLYMDFEIYLMALSRNGTFMVNPQTIGAVWQGGAGIGSDL